MTPEIEKRIKAVRAGRVPAGYKKSKVGIVPKEWEELKLSHYLTVSKEKNKDLQYSKDDVFSISGELGIVNQIELLGRSYAGESVAPYGIVKPNDIVYTKSPLKANPYGIIKTNKTGKTGIVSTLYAIFNCKNNVNPNFVQYYFESDKNLNDYLHPIVNIGAKHDMKISDENSLSGIVVFPPLSEQKKIAEILATQDRVIELKEKLIAEKQSQKKYLQNEILFHKKKKNAILGDVSTLIATRSSDYLSHYVSTENMISNYGGVAFSGERKIIEGVSFCKEDILVANIRPYLKKAWIATIAGVCSADVLVLRAKKINPMYLYFVIASDDFVNYVMSGVKGTKMPRGDKRFILKKSIYVPSLLEQRKIAEVLSATDKEIELLKADLEQEKLKKKSLMQLLLTGLVRVA